MLRLGKVTVLYVTSLSCVPCHACHLGQKASPGDWASVAQPPAQALFVGDKYKCRQLEERTTTFLSYGSMS